jgi:hypothetical protein
VVLIFIEPVSNGCLFHSGSINLNRPYPESGLSGYRLHDFSFPHQKLYSFLKVTSLTKLEPGVRGVRFGYSLISSAV